MTYVPSQVPPHYSPAYIAEEMQRIANAFNYQAAIGQLAIDPNGTPSPTSQVITSAAAKINNWNLIGPLESVSDGPIMTAPRLSPDNDILVLEDGIYLVNFFVAYDHPKGAEIIWEIYRNDNAVGVGAVVDSSQQTDRSTTSATSVLVNTGGGKYDLRASVPAGESNETITATSGALSVYKIKDLRERFS